jgi:hypothetical protein
MKTIFLIPIGILGLVSCKSNPSKKVENLQGMVHSDSTFFHPINDLRIESETFTFSTEKDKTISLKSGSTLFIPANSFVDKAGNPIHGEVDINWNEFHSLGEVLLSGITMKYDSAGIQNDLITGGMFKIEAFQHEEELFLAPSKKIKVDILSKSGVERMNFYKMDENSGDWTYKQTQTATPRKLTLEQANKSTGSDDTDFSLLDIAVKTDSFPELKNKQIVGWKTNNKLKNSDLNKLQFSDVESELVATQTPNEYRLRITKTTKLDNRDYVERFSMLVRPYFLEEATKDSKLVADVFEETKQELNNYLDKMKKNEVVRSIEISSLGVYNWDYLYHRSGSKNVFCHLNYPENTNPLFMSVFTICPEDNALVRLNFTEEGEYIYDPSKRNCIIAISEENRVYYINNNDFRAVENESKNITFNFKKSDLILKNAQSFDAHLSKFI